MIIFLIPPSIPKGPDLLGSFTIVVRGRDEVHFLLGEAALSIIYPRTEVLKEPWAGPVGKAR